MTNYTCRPFFLLTVHIWSMVLIHFSIERKCILLYLTVLHGPHIDMTNNTHMSAFLLYYTVLHGPHIAMTNNTCRPFFPSHRTYMVHGPHTF
jgi:hypothetical protein